MEWWLPESFSIVLQSTRFGHQHEVTVVPVIIVWPIIIIFRCLLTRGSPMGRQEACADCAEIIWESWRHARACLKSQKLFLCCSVGCCSAPDISAPAQCPPASCCPGQALLAPLSLASPVLLPEKPEFNPWQPAACSQVVVGGGWAGWKWNWLFPKKAVGLCCRSWLVLLFNRSNDSVKWEGLHKDCWEFFGFKGIWQLKLDSEINFVDLRWG